jgi:DNA polymerase-3 subunit epsilon
MMFDWMMGAAIGRKRPTLTSHRQALNWRDTRFVCIDVETTGLNLRRDQIVAYGAVPIEGGCVRVSEAIEGLVGIDAKVPGASTCIHTIRTQDLQSAPPLADCARRIDDLVGDSIVVAHGAWIERAFLRRAYRSAAMQFDCPIIDTALLCQRLLKIPAVPGHVVALEYAATYLGLPVHPPHEALGDALTTATLFIALIGHLARQTHLSVGQILELSTTAGRVNVTATVEQETP